MDLYLTQAEGHNHLLPLNLILNNLRSPEKILKDMDLPLLGLILQKNMIWKNLLNSSNPLMTGLQLLWMRTTTKRWKKQKLKSIHPILSPFLLTTGIVLTILQLHTLHLLFINFFFISKLTQSSMDIEN